MDYIPKKDSEKAIWNTHLSAKIEADGPLLGLTPDEIIQYKAICNANADAIVANDTAQTAARSARATRNTQIKTGEKALREMIRTIKTNKNYTTTLGTSWGIIGDDTPVDYSKYHPKIKARVMPGRVRINFIKGKLNGMNIYSRLNGEAHWVKLAYNSFTPFEDTRPLAVPNVPEHREYMAIGVLRDEEVTQQSSIIEAVFGG